MTDMTLLNFLPPVIGHRGAAAYAPENTISSFTKAAQLGAKWIEFDVMLSSDGIPMIFHDETLNRTTNGRGYVADYTFSQLRTLDAGAWFDFRCAGERIPALQQALEFLQNAKLAANIEIKPLPGEDKATVRNALEVVLPYFPQPNTSILFSSFSITSLEELRLQQPDAYLGLLMHEWLPDWQAVAEGLQCVSVHVNQSIMTEDKVKKIKDSGKMLLCYTVNDPLRARELYSWGVDAIFSDCPDKIIDII
jgi:glycerophosphoryl diester phosphodiesterase